MTLEEQEQPRLVTDLHLHSRFSIGTSHSLDLTALTDAAKAKGIDVLATGDFTHGEWLHELSRNLSQVAEGLFEFQGARFVLGTELACIWRQDGRGRRVHILALAPGFAQVEGIRKALRPFGNLDTNARPMLKIPVRDLVDAILSVDETCILIPAHVWTPWYGVYGSRSGFDSLTECFGGTIKYIHAIETGLSSDPAMNWRVEELDPMTIVSFSDAHSAHSLGRELTVLSAHSSYPAIRSAIINGDVMETVEFHPEHGKYHYDGHRKCGVRFSPRESMETDGVCPRCGRALTLGVLHRVEELASREVSPKQKRDGLVYGPESRPPYRPLLPLCDVLAQVLNVGRGSKRVASTYERLTANLGGEYRVLAHVPCTDIEAVAGEQVASALTAIREGRVNTDPGYDGEWGNVSIRPS